MSETPLTAIGDEAIEARIVAWVLGEASAFEIAELERLCEERAELMIFKRRVAVLHGMIAESEKPEQGSVWKLPPDKRKAVEELYSPQPVAAPDTRKHHSVRQSARRTMIAMAACLILSVVIAGILAPSSLQRARKMTSSRDAEPEIMTYQPMVALKPDFPPELIEGTPRPIILPGQAPSRERTALADSSRAVDAMVMKEREVQTSTERKPSAPSSSMTKAIAASGLSDIAIAVPEVDVTTPSLDFGDGVAFGGGWGDASGAGGGFGGEPTDGRRSGDGTIVPGSIDGMADVREGGLKRDLSALEEPKKDIPLVGRLFNSPDGVTEATQGIVPQIATRSILSPDEAAQEAQKLRKVGRYDEARSTLEGALATAPGDPKLANELAALDDPLRTNPALTYEHTQNVDKVRRGLYMAEGNINLGQYDDAKKEYENVLRTDPYNKAARRGMERIASAKSDYYRAAYDHTGAELLSEVDQAWELKIPGEGKDDDSEAFKQSEVVVNEDGKNVEFNGFVHNGSPISGKDTQSNAWWTGDVSEKADIGSLKTPSFTGAWSNWDETPSGGGNLNGAIHADAPFNTNGGTDDVLPQLLAEVDKAWELAVPAEKAEQTKPDLTQLIEEISAAEEPYSTFSLNISDASFRIAQAAMAKGERPDPVGVKVEQFYNAVNYGDPAPGAGEPVACFIEQSAHPMIPGRNLVRVAMKTAAAGRSAAQPLRLTLLIDQSGSMSRADRRAAMDTAMRSLGTLLTDKDLVTVIGFSRTSRLLADSMKGDEVGKKLAGLVNQTASEGGTNLEEAIKLAEQKALSQKLEGAQNRIVLFTDGAANLGDADPQRLAAKVEQLRQQGIAFDIAGIAADDLNDELLAELARKGNGRYSVVGKSEEQDFAKQLAGAFRPAAENVKVQVRFNPERVARYKLIGFEKDRLKTEDFRNDAVDAAELAAEEAGVAIYQVEPLLEGRGEIGEVSVRFRDTASGEMVERMWTMAHDPATPAADRAAPSMQLAVLAMLAGEKLKGGPLADAIDFKQLAQAQAIVKQAFGLDTRVAEMLHMVDALK